MAAAMIELWRRGGGLAMSPFPPGRVVSSGLYGLLRDPIYVGAVAACLGYAILQQSGAGMWVVTPVLAMAAASFVLGYERRATTARFGSLPPVRVSLPRRRSGSANTVGAGLGVRPRAHPVGRGLRGPEPGWVRARHPVLVHGVGRSRSGRAMDCGHLLAHLPVCRAGAGAGRQPVGLAPLRSPRPLGDRHDRALLPARPLLRRAEARAGRHRLDRAAALRTSLERAHITPVVPRRVGLPGQRGVRIAMAPRAVGLRGRRRRHRRELCHDGHARV